MWIALIVFLPEAALDNPIVDTSAEFGECQSTLPDAPTAAQTKETADIWNKEGTKGTKTHVQWANKNKININCNSLLISLFFIAETLKHIFVLTDHRRPAFLNISHSGVRLLCHGFYLKKIRVLIVLLMSVAMLWNISIVLTAAGIWTDALLAEGACHFVLFLLFLLDWRFCFPQKMPPKIKQISAT